MTDNDQPIRIIGPADKDAIAPDDPLPEELFWIAHAGPIGHAPRAGRQLDWQDRVSTRRIVLNATANPSPQG